MKVGNELDALIAEKVMGHEVSRYGDTDAWYDEQGHWIKPYSTDIAAAWQVVNKIADSRDPHWFSIDRWYGTWVAGWRCGDSAPDDPSWELEMTADTAPLAICLAALKAKGVKV